VGAAKERSTMPLYLVRHGQTDWNLERRFQSRTDIPLNETGRAQARALRAELVARGVNFAQARCSPLSRARETALLALEGSGVEPLDEPAFVEIDVGDYEQQREADLRERLGAEVYDDWRARHYLEPAPGGESLFDCVERVRGPLLALAGAARAGDVLVVGHQAVNMAMKAALSGRSDLESLRDFLQGNGEVDVWDPAGRRLDRFTAGA